MSDYTVIWSGRGSLPGSDELGWMQRYTPAQYVKGTDIKGLWMSKDEYIQRRQAGKCGRCGRAAKGKYAHCQRCRTLEAASRERRKAMRGRR